MENKSDENLKDISNSSLKKMRKKGIAIFSLCFVILAGFLIFTKNYKIPLPFDANRMSVEPVASVVVEKDGRTSWVELNTAIHNSYVENDCKDVINVLNRNYKGINGISEESVGRTISRDGNEVRVVYYCYTKTLWNSLFVDSDLQEYSEGGRSTGTDMYGEHFQSIAYKPQMIEVYYLPQKNLHELENLSDVEYDNLKEKSDLIFSGMI
nr:hypothetical protein [Lacrimispora amygdalina]